MKTNYLEKAENKDYFWKPKLFFNQRRKIYVLYRFSDYGRKAQEIHSQEFRLINDDTVEAVVDDPRGYKRI